MGYTQELIKRSDEYRIVIDYSDFDGYYRAELQQIDKRLQWHGRCFGVGDSVETAIESLNEIVEDDGSIVLESPATPGADIT